MFQTACAATKLSKKSWGSPSRLLALRARAGQVEQTPGKRNPVPACPSARERRVDAACVSMAALVRKVAYQFARRLPAHVDFDDLVGAGSVGLVLAVRQHADKPQDELERLALKRIRGAMLDYLRASDPLTRRQRAAVGAVQKAREALEKVGAKAGLAEVATTLGMTLRRAEQIEHRLVTIQLTSLASTEELTGVSEPMDDLVQRERQRTVAQALAKLPKRLQTLLSLYYYEELTYQEISEVLAISRSRVCQLHAQAIEALRRAMHTQTGEV